MCSCSYMINTIPRPHRQPLCALVSELRWGGTEAADRARVVAAANGRRASGVGRRCRLFVTRPDTLRSIARCHCHCPPGPLSIPSLPSLPQPTTPHVCPRRPRPRRRPPVSLSLSLSRRAAPVCTAACPRLCSGAVMPARPPPPPTAHPTAPSPLWPTAP